MSLRAKGLQIFPPQSSPHHYRKFQIFLHFLHNSFQKFSFFPRQQPLSCATTVGAAFARCGGGGRTVTGLCGLRRGSIPEAAPRGRRPYPFPSLRRTTGRTPSPAPGLSSVAPWPRAGMASRGGTSLFGCWEATPPLRPATPLWGGQVWGGGGPAIMPAGAARHSSRAWVLAWGHFGVTRFCPPPQSLEGRGVVQSGPDPLPPSAVARHAAAHRAARRVRAPPLELSPHHRTGSQRCTVPNMLQYAGTRNSPPKKDNLYFFL